MMRRVLALILGSVLMVPLAGCDDYSGGGDGPQLLEASVSCSADVWSFSVQAEDPDGEADISLVYVDIFDVAYSENTAVGSVDLTGGAGGAWSASQGSGSDGLRGCDAKAEFEFDFWVSDQAGNLDSGRTVAD